MDRIVLITLKILLEIKMKKMKLHFKFFYISIIILQSLKTRCDATKLYLDLMKKCLINSIYQDLGYIPGTNQKLYDSNLRENGKDWPTQAHTMIGLKRLNNLQSCCEQVIKEKIPGDFIETGVWRGGATIFMKAILKAYNIKEKKVWVADSFEGLPAPNPELYPEDKDLFLNQYSFLAVSLEEVKENFRRYDLLDENVNFLKGWFKDTLPLAKIDKLSILRLDGDLYESTIQVLEELYPKLSVGGYVIIDDYKVFKACRKAVEDYRMKHNIEDDIIEIDWGGVYFRKMKS